MTGGDSVRFTIISDGESPVKCETRVLFWWEEQGIKYESLAQDSSYRQRFIDEPACMRLTLNASVISLEQDGEKLSEEDLDGGTWSERTDHSFLEPWYRAYVANCGIDSEEERRFIAAIKAYIDPSNREGMGDYVVPPEVLEYEMLLRTGGISRTELRSLSYAEFKKLQIVMQMMGFGAKRPTPMSSVGPGASSGPMDSALLADPNLSPEQTHKANQQTLEMIDNFSDVVLPEADRQLSSAIPSLPDGMEIPGFNV